MKRMQSGRVPLLPIANLNTFLDKQHIERDHFYEEVATLAIDSISVEDDVNKIIKSIEK